MKLLRYETSTSGTSGGQEKPGLLDEAGVLRDLSGIVDDIAGETLLPENIERLRKTLTPHRFLKWKAIRVSAHA